MLTPKDELEFLIELQELCEKHKVKNICGSYEGVVFVQTLDGSMIEINDAIIASPETISKRIEELENVSS